MTLKRRLQWISFGSSLLVPVGLALWIRGLATEDWSTMEARVDFAWTLIPCAILAAIVSGVWAAKLPSPPGTKDRMSWILVGLGILLGILILVGLLNLGIR